MCLYESENLLTQHIIERENSRKFSSLSVVLLFLFLFLVGVLTKYETFSHNLHATKLATIHTRGHLLMPTTASKRCENDIKCVPEHLILSRTNLSLRIFLFSIWRVLQRAEQQIIWKRNWWRKNHWKFFVLWEKL